MKGDPGRDGIKVDFSLYFFGSVSMICRYATFRDHLDNQGGLATEGCLVTMVQRVLLVFQGNQELMVHQA